MERGEGIELLFKNDFTIEGFNEYLNGFLNKSADRNIALKEVDNKICVLNNYLLLISVHLKQNFILKCLENKIDLDSEYFTKKELAKKFKVSVRTIDNWIMDGLETIIMGTGVRIEKNAIDKFQIKAKAKKYNWKSIAR